MNYLQTISGNITKKKYLVWASFLGFLLLTKLVYLFASEVWREDIFYYLEASEKVLSGGNFYNDFFMIRLPGIYSIVYSLLKISSEKYVLIFIKIFSLIVQFFSAVVLYYLIDNLYKNKVRAFLFSLFFIFFISLHRELWTFKVMLLSLLPIFSALYFLTRENFRSNYIDIICSGFCVGVATILATNLGIYSLLFPVWFFYQSRSIKKALTQSFFAFIGFLIPVSIVFFIFIINSWSSFSYQAFIWARFYASHYPFWLRIWKFFYAMFLNWQLIPFFVFGFIAFFKLVKIKNCKKNKVVIFSIFVFIICILARLALSRGTVRYNLFLFPGLFLVIAALSKEIIFKYLKYSLLFFLLGFLYSSYMGIASNPKLEKWRLEPKDYSWIKEHSKQKDSIYVWPEGHDVYFKTQRRMSTIFFSANEQLDNPYMWSRGGYKYIPFHWEKFLKQFKEKPPKLIVDLSLDFSGKNIKKREKGLSCYTSQFLELVSENYEKAYLSQKVVVWKLKGLQKKISIRKNLNCKEL